MYPKDPQAIRQEAYSEAVRYMENARETLKKAGKEDQRYKDPKYVKTACGTAYSGVLLALDAYLLLKGIKKTKRRKSIEYYCKHLSNLDGKLLHRLNNVYEALHLNGYYEGVLNARIVKAGFDDAYKIIDSIKPQQ
jgi:uncharacterized protein (UPF0332 family)